MTQGLAEAAGFRAWLQEVAAAGGCDGLLDGYLGIIQEHFDDVQQIQSIYATGFAFQEEDFCDDAGIEDLEHRALFVAWLAGHRSEAVAVSPPVAPFVRELLPSPLCTLLSPPVPPSEPFDLCDHSDFERMPCGLSPVAGAQAVHNAPFVGFELGADSFAAAAAAAADPCDNDAAWEYDSSPAWWEPQLDEWLRGLGGAELAEAYGERLAVHFASAEMVLEVYLDQEAGTFLSEAFFYELGIDHQEHQRLFQTWSEAALAALARKEREDSESEVEETVHGKSKATSEGILATEAMTVATANARGDSASPRKALGQRGGARPAVAGA